MREMMFLCFLLGTVLGSLNLHQKPGLVAQGANFTLDGEPIRILSGSLHYFRVPKEYWRDRLEKLKGAGLNTVQTYIAWNLHEPREGDFIFEDELDVSEFLRIAKDVGLYVIMRPGPYICAEWEWGGFPAWLLTKENMIVRQTKSATFLAAVQNWFTVLFSQLREHQWSNGGPIISIQVENEYASYNKDPDYLPWVKNLLIDVGATELLFTSDGPYQMSRPGAHLLADTFLTANFQSVGDAFQVLEKLQPNRPKMVTEFWAGWFDHWGQQGHSILSPATFNKTMREILNAGSSVNQYMFHGGTSFGWMAGSNWLSKKQRATSDTTSYDYDAPLSESGDITEKWNITREIIKEYFPNYVNDSFIFKRPEIKKYDSLPMSFMTDIWDFVSDNEKLLRELEYEQPSAAKVSSMENFKGRFSSPYGYALYQSQVNCNGENKMTISNLHSALSPNMTRVTIFVDTFNISTVNLIDDFIPDEIKFDCRSGEQKTISFLAENAGRVNFARLDGNFAGLTDTPKFSSYFPLSHNWTQISLPLDELQLRMATTQTRKNSVQLPGFFRTTLFANETQSGFDFPHDTYIDFGKSGWGKGAVFVNGKNLGRYWSSVGPQQTLYLPGPWLKHGDNEIIVFEEEQIGEKLEFSSVPRWNQQRFS